MIPQVKANDVSLEATHHAFAIALETDQYIVQPMDLGTYNVQVCLFWYFERMGGAKLVCKSGDVLESIGGRLMYLCEFEGRCAIILDIQGHSRAGVGRRLIQRCQLETREYIDVND